MAGVQMEIVPNNSGSDRRTPVRFVAGLDAAAVARAADALVVAGTALVHHDLRRLAEGVVVRTLRQVDLDGRERSTVTRVDLEHGCASCTLRADLLPLLRRLHRRSSVESIVLQLDPILEPEAVSWAIDEVIVSDMPGFVDAPAGIDVRIDATVACVGEVDWLDAATGDVTLTEAGLVASGPDDDRTLAQVAVGQVGFADAIIVAGCDPPVRDTWSSARLAAVLKRLAPGAPIIMELPQRPITGLLAANLLAAIGPGARRGRIDGPHDSLLRGQPPLHPDCGVTLVEFHADRPFHPVRLHDAIDVLLDGVVTARGRLWTATQPDLALWLESAGGGLRVASGGRWLAALDEGELHNVSPERRAMAALRWDDTYGDRHSSVVVLAHRADPDSILEALRDACLTDAEMAAGQLLWMAYDDPFGIGHVDPCETPDHSDDLADSIDGADSTHRDGSTREDRR